MLTIIIFKEKEIKEEYVAVPFLCFQLDEFLSPKMASKLKVPNENWYLL